MARQPPAARPVNEARVTAEALRLLSAVHDSETPRILESRPPLQTGTRELFRHHPSVMASVPWASASTAAMAPLVSGPAQVQEERLVRLVDGASRTTIVAVFVAAPGMNAGSSGCGRTVAGHARE